MVETSEKLSGHSTEMLKIVKKRYLKIWLICQHDLWKTRETLNNFFFNLIFEEDSEIPLHNIPSDGKYLSGTTSIMKSCIYGTGDIREKIVENSCGNWKTVRKRFRIYSISVKFNGKLKEILQILFNVKEILGKLNENEF